MIPNAKVCLYPKDAAEATRVLADLGSRALIIAGGTTAALSTDPAVDTLVDITRLGYDSVELRDGYWEIGCNVRAHQLAQHDGLAAYAGGMLCKAASSIGSRPIRNAVTIGGNLVQVNRWSDMPGAFLALDAQIVLFGPDGERSIGAEEFFSHNPRKTLKAGELLLQVKVPIRENRHGGFVKFSRTATDFSVVDAAVCLDKEGGKVAGARLVVAGARSRPFRALEAEAVLLGRKPSSARLKEAATKARLSTKAIPDTRTSAEYRQRMVEVVMLDALKDCVALFMEDD